MNKPVELFCGLRWQLIKDDTSFKADLFERYLDAKPFIISFCYSIIARHKTGLPGFLSCCAFFIFKFMTIRISVNPVFLTSLKLKNEKSTFQEVIHAEYRPQIAFVSENPLHIFFNLRESLSRTTLTSCLKLARIMKSLLKKHPLFVVLRAVEYLAYFIKLHPLFLSGTIRSVLIFTDGNPHGLALTHLAKKFNKEITFISHGEPNEPVYPVQCHTAFLWGCESQQRYLKANGCFDRVVFRGHQESYTAMRPLSEQIKQIGFFLSKSTPIDVVPSLIAQIIQLFHPEHVLVRVHPSFALSDKMRSDLTAHPKVRISSQKDILEDAAASDLVFAGNTTSHVQILLSGTPSLYCFALENSYHDRCGYVKSGLTLEWKPDLNVSAINTFYTQPDFRKRLNWHLDLNKNLETSIDEINDLIFKK